MSFLPTILYMTDVTPVLEQNPVVSSLSQELSTSKRIDGSLFEKEFVKSERNFSLIRAKSFICAFLCIRNFEVQKGAV